MNNIAALPIPEDIRIVVPNDFTLMTPYILLEQQDWFEDEIRFLRETIPSGKNVIDIGANYGTYTMTLARKVGSSGKVLAFEPTASTAACLRQSIELNHASNVELIQAGLSNRSGSATFYTSKNGELNSLSPSPGMKQETIRLTTLDETMEKYGWPEIDFIKLDAENEEIRIIEGGVRTLSQNDPLVMFELKSPEGIHYELINAFEQRGYHPYRLVPETDFLIPYNASHPTDGYWINLFCCKDSRAERLEAEDILSRNMPSPEKAPAEDYLHVVKELKIIWERSGSRYERTARLAALAKQAEEIRTRGASIEELAASSRIFLAFGERQKAIDEALKLIRKIGEGAQTNPAFPLLSPSPDMPPCRPSDPQLAWLYAAAFSLLIHARSFSSFYTGKDDLSLIEVIEKNGFMTESLARRKYLIEKRFSQNRDASGSK